MDYVLIAVIVFLSSYAGASLSARGEKKSPNVVTKFIESVSDKIESRSVKEEIMTEIQAVEEWFNGRAGGNEDER